MFSIFLGAFVISILHALIPNHWLPIIAIGKREDWSIGEVTQVTLICAVAHGASTILIGIVLGLLGATLNSSFSNFTSAIAPIILMSMGLLFVYRHHRHKHFHVDSDIQKKRSKAAIITALAVAMLFSPCMEIEAYFLLAGAQSFLLVCVVAIMYIAVTSLGMVLLVRYAYKALLKLNWHSLEHNAGIITGITLIITGIVSFFIF